MTNQKIDIKSLTSELKNRSRVHRESNAKPVSKSNFQEEPSQVSSVSEQDLRRLFNEVNSKGHYEMNRFIYVDADIHEVFNKIKTETKLRLSYLASHLLEKFIIENQEAIKSILSKKQNKFLD